MAPQPQRHNDNQEPRIEPVVPIVIHNLAGLEVMVVLLTPDLAKYWLATGAPNRPLSRTRYMKYARDITLGNWGLTGEAIQFNLDVRMCNG